MPEDLDRIWEDEDPIEPYDRDNKPKERGSNQDSSKEKTTPARRQREVPTSDPKWDKYKL